MLKRWLDPKWGSLCVCLCDSANSCFFLTRRSCFTWMHSHTHTYTHCDWRYHPLGLTVIVHLTTGDRNYKSTASVFSGRVCFSRKGNFPSQSDQKEYLASILLTFNGSGSQCGEEHMFMMFPVWCLMCTHREVVSDMLICKHLISPI